MKTYNIEDRFHIKYKIDMNPVIIKYSTAMRDKLRRYPTPIGRDSRPHKYIETWHYSMRPNKHEAIVYNKENYRLTHLLENGHFIVNRKDGKLGWARAKPHIQLAFNYVAPKFVEAMEKCLIIDETK